MSANVRDLPLCNFHVAVQFEQTRKALLQQRRICEESDGRLRTLQQELDQREQTLTQREAAVSQKVQRFLLASAPTFFRKSM